MSLPYQDIAWASFDQGAEKLRGLRIGLLLDAGCGLPVEPEVLAAVQAAARRFEAAGAIVEPMQPFMTQAMLDGMDHFWRMRSRMDLAALTPDDKARVLPYIRAWADSAAGMDGEAVFRAASQFHAVRVASVKACAAFDYVISPTAPMPAFAAELPSPTNDPAEAAGAHRLHRALQHVGAARRVASTAATRPTACRSACRSPASALTTWACCRSRAPLS